MKKTLIAILLTLSALTQPLAGMAADIPAYEEIYAKMLEFSSRYPYKEGDVEKSLSTGIGYTSGIETRADGVEYECPAIYRDEDAASLGDFDLEKGEMSLYVNGQPSTYGGSCVLCNSVTLVPYEVFSELGCDIAYDGDYYLTTIANDNAVLEIIPYMIGMRKNRADGYYVPLNACARYVDGELCVPLRAVAEELGFSVGWDGETNSVTLNG